MYPQHNKNICVSFCKKKEKEVRGWGKMKGRPKLGGHRVPAWSNKELLETEVMVGQHRERS
jgi:hypothetical protein